jgi:hypothetical protein
MSSPKSTRIGGIGKRVVADAIGLLHKDEVVLPDAGSAAQAVRVADDARAVIHYHFPVEIEVRHTGTPIDVEKLVAAAFDELTSHLESLT